MLTVQIIGTILDLVQNVKYCSEELFWSGPKHFGPVRTNLNELELTYALPFYRSQNVLCRSKLFEPAQKLKCVLKKAAFLIANCDISLQDVQPGQDCDLEDLRLERN